MRYNSRKAVDGTAGRSGMTTETMIQTQATANAGTTVSTKTSIRVSAALAFIFGAGLGVTTGIAGSSVLHNAAHDTRHTLAFPCH